MTVSFTQKLRVSPDTLVNVLGDESVLLNLENETYYGLDEIGTRMWSAVTTSDSIQAAYETLLAEYEVGADELRGDLSELVEKLVADKLVEVQ